MLNIFSVYDSKAEAFIQPFFSQTIGTALRDFGRAANDAQHQFHQHAGDYTLFHLGSFDPNKADFTLLKAHANLGTALTFINDTLVESAL